MLAYFYAHFERENVHTADKDSDLMLTVLSSMAQEEAVNAGTSSQWGKRKLAEILFYSFFFN